MINDMKKNYKKSMNQLQDTISGLKVMHDKEVGCTFTDVSNMGQSNSNLQVGPLGGNTPQDEQSIKTTFLSLQKWQQS